MPYGLERADRPSELDVLDRVVTCKPQHRALRSHQFVCDRQLAQSDRAGPVIGQVVPVDGGKLQRSRDLQQAQGRIEACERPNGQGLALHGGDRDAFVAHGRDAALCHDFEGLPWRGRAA